MAKYIYAMDTVTLSTHSSLVAMPPTGSDFTSPLLRIVANGTMFPYSLARHVEDDYTPLP